MLGDVPFSRPLPQGAPRKRAERERRLMGDCAHRNVIALLGASAFDVVAAWIYVALRIVHSVWQATVNVVKIRFLLFFLSSAALMYLAYRAIALTMFHDPSLAPA